MAAGKVIGSDKSDTIPALLSSRELRIRMMETPIAIQEALLRFPKLAEEIVQITELHDNGSATLQFKGDGNYRTKLLVAEAGQAMSKGE